MYAPDAYFVSDKPFYFVNCDSYALQPAMMIENVTVFSNLMGVSTMRFGEEGKDQSTARAPKRTAVF